MSRLSGYFVSTEKITFKHTSALFKGLTDTFKTLQDSRPTPRQVADSNLIALTMAETGMRIRPILATDSPKTAGIIVPRLNRNHALFTENDQRTAGNIDFYRMVTKQKKILEGTVNLETGKVTGIFSEINMDIYIGTDFFKSKKFTPEEAAAVFLHELGHGFTSYAQIDEIVRTDYVLSAIGQAYGQRFPVEKKMLLLHEVDRATGIKIPDKELIAKGPQASAEAIIIREKVNTLRSELNTDFYDMRSFEFVSDQFAVNHGAGVHLATALEKVNRTQGPNSLSRPVYWGMETLRLLFSIVSWVGLGMLATSLLAQSLSEYRYDTQGSRVKHIREQLVQELKQPNLSRHQRDALVDGIEAIERIEERLIDRSGLVVFIHRKILPWGRRNDEVRKVSEQLETMANNPMFKQAVKFKQLAENRKVKVN